MQKNLFLLSLLFLLQPKTWAIHWELGGSLKNLFSFEELRQNGLFQRNSNLKDETRLRLQGSLSLRHFRFEFANETFFNFQKPNPSLLPTPDFSPLSAWRAQWDLINQSDWHVFNRLDRAFLQWDIGDLQLRAGKQVVALGVAHIFNAVSQMQRYPLIFIDPEFPKTEDAVSFIWAGPLQFEARYLPKVSGQSKDNFHLRAKGGRDGWDFALTAGRSDDKAFWGLESAGGIGDALLRLELVGYNSKTQDYAQGLLGWDYIFSPSWSTKFEFFYNGFGEKTQTTLAPYPHRSSPFRGAWYCGNWTTWEIHPLLKSHLISVVNLRDPSALLHLFFNYSLGNSWDLLAGRFMGLGKEQSEFGGKLDLAPGISFGQPDITYLALRWYF